MFFNIHIGALQLFLAGLFSMSSACPEEPGLKIISDEGNFKIKQSLRRTPDVCRFLVLRDVCYSCIPLCNGEEACVGVDRVNIGEERKRIESDKNRDHERCGFITKDDIGHIKNATDFLVKEEGWMKSLSSGNWTASFLFFTTAFASRDIETFKDFVDGFAGDGNQPVRQLYWSRGRNMMLQVKKEGCHLQGTY